MFDNAIGNRFTGAVLVTQVQGNQIVTSEPRKLKDPLSILSPYYKDIHYSLDEFPHHQTCMEGTRERIVNTMMEWARNPDSESIFYLHGPTGSGKSTIARTIAMQCQAERLLAASFIDDTSPVVRKLPEVVLTILYQLIAHFPGISDEVYRRLTIGNGQILENDADIQLRALLVEPMLAHYEVHDTTTALDTVPYATKSSSSSSDKSLHPSIVIIDGLESYDSKEVAKLVAALFAAVSTRKFPLKFFVVSTTLTTTTEVVYIKQSQSPGLVLIAPLDGSLNPENDIRIYLRACFEYIYKYRLPKRPNSLPKPWPEDDFFESIVLRSSKQFCYASAIVKYIHDFKDPQDGVLALQNIYTPSTTSPKKAKASLDPKSPFEQLNERYIGILREAGGKLNEGLLEIQIALRPVIAMLDFEEIPTGEVIDNLFGLRGGKTEVRLSSLQSLIQVADYTENPPSRIDVHHADFVEFLLDPVRSTATYHLDIENCHAAMAVHCVSFLGRLQKQEDMKHLCHSKTHHYAISRWISHFHKACLSEKLLKSLQRINIKQLIVDTANAIDLKTFWGTFYAVWSKLKLKSTQHPIAKVLWEVQAAEQTIFRNIEYKTEISESGFRFLRRLEHLRSSLSLPAITVLLSQGDGTSYSHWLALFDHLASLPGDPLMCVTTRQHFFKFQSTSDDDMYSDPGQDYSYLTLCCFMIILARYKEITPGVTRVYGSFFASASDFTTTRNGESGDRPNSIDWKLCEMILYDSASPAKPVTNNFMYEALDHARNQWPAYLSRSSPTTELQEWIIDHMQHVEILRNVDAANGRDTFKNWAMEHCNNLRPELQKLTKDDEHKQMHKSIGEKLKDFNRRK